MSFATNFMPEAFAETNLFKPMKLGNMELKHRAVMPALTRLRAVNPGQLPNVPLAKEYYGQRSKREGTFIISEAAIISRQAGGIDDAPGIYTEEQIKAWSEVIKTVHDNGSYMFIQFWALGRNAFAGLLKRDGLKYVSASDNEYIDNARRDISFYANNHQHGLTKEEIKTFVEDFATASKNSIKAGADGVEIHSAYGYFLNQFLDPASNKRTDEYGGSIENRSRIVLEVIDACIEAVGAEKVGVRFSPWATYIGMSGSSDPTLLATYAYLIGEMEKRRKAGKKIAYLHMVEPTVTDPGLLEGEGIDTTGNNEFAYSIWKGPIIRSGTIAARPAVAKEMVAEGRTLLAYGRYFIANPDLVDRLEKGLPLNAYNRMTFYGGAEEGLTDYPTYEEALKAGY